MALKNSARGDPVLSTFFVGYRFTHNQFFRLKRVDKMVKYAKKDRVDKMVFLMHILPFYPRCDCLEVTMF